MLIPSGRSCASRLYFLGSNATAVECGYRLEGNRLDSRAGASVTEAQSILRNKTV